MRFVNGADALRYRLVPQEGTQALRRQARTHPSPPEPLPEEGKGVPVAAVLAGWNTSRPVRPNLDRHGGVVWNREKKATVIYGVWDLPMIGNERFDIERRYQRMSGGPEVIPVCWVGTLVQRGDIACQLFTRKKGVHVLLPNDALPADCVCWAREPAPSTSSRQRSNVRSSPPRLVVQGWQRGSRATCGEKEA